jgi:glycosyltransferase involved in cell wall biosynthesis
LKQIPNDVKLVDKESNHYDLFTDNKSCTSKIIKILGSVLGQILAFGNWNKGRQIRWNFVYSHVIPKLKNSYDIAMAYLEGEATYYVVDKVSAKKKVAWFHNDYNKLKYDSRLDEQFFVQLDKVVTISDECAKILKSYFPKIRKKIVVLPNITSAKSIHMRSEMFTPTEYEQDRMILLSIGRLTYQKGFDIAIDAARFLKKKGYKFHWYIIGKGELEADLKKMIALADINDCLTLLGVRENPYPYIRCCDVFVQSSRFEGKSVVLDEAKILGKPIIVTNYETVKDQIIDNKEGIIVSMDPEGIASGIEKMILNKNIVESIREYLKGHSYGNVQDLSMYYEIL